MSANATKSGSGVQFFPGQENALASIFGAGGVFDSLLSGKPNAGQERAQAVGVQQLGRQQASMGTFGQPLGARQTSDFVQDRAQRQGDNFLAQLQGFMQPAGSQSKSTGAGAGLK